MRQAVFEYLTNDVDFMASLPGGFYDAELVGEISRQNTPAAFDDNKVIRPCGLLNMRGPTATDDLPHSAAQGFSLIFYERSGAGQIEMARERAYTMLHNQRLDPIGATFGCLEIHHTNDVLDQEDQALRVPMKLSRYEVIINRRA